VDKVALRQDFLKVLRFSVSVSFHLCSIFTHVLSGNGSVFQRHGLTSSQQQYEGEISFTLPTCAVIHRKHILKIILIPDQLEVFILIFHVFVLFLFRCPYFMYFQTFSPVFLPTFLTYSLRCVFSSLLVPYFLCMCVCVSIYLSIYLCFYLLIFFVPFLHMSIFPCLFILSFVYLRSSLILSLYFIIYMLCVSFNLSP
jgi:hypothetical protein